MEKINCIPIFYNILCKTIIIIVPCQKLNKYIG